MNQVSLGYKFVHFAPGHNLLAALWWWLNFEDGEAAWIISQNLLLEIPEMAIDETIPWVL